MSTFSVRAWIAAPIAVAALAACGTTAPAQPAADQNRATPTATASPAPAATHTAPAPAATHATPAPAATHTAKPKHKKKHNKPAATAPVTQAPPTMQAPPPT